MQTTPVSSTACGAAVVVAAPFASGRAAVRTALPSLQPARQSNFAVAAGAVFAGIGLATTGAGVAAAVAGAFSGRALAAQPALVDGTVGVVWAPGGAPKVVWDITILNGKIVHIYMVAAAESLNELDLLILED